MSIQNDKIVFDKKLKSGRGLVWFLGALEVGLTVILAFVIATTKIFSPSASSAPGITQNLSYQGRLTDASGNALGGTGTNYCFRFSIYDAVSGGNKLWPSGTPGTTTLNVISGVFNASIGGVDTLDYNFYPTSSVYLNVDVYTVTSTCTGGSWETLAPRQEILATGYSIAAENVYGDLLKTDIASSLVQIGTGAGVSSSSVEKLGFDVANTAENVGVGTTCTPNGSVWYNSNASNTQALICENGTVRAITGVVHQNVELPYKNSVLASSRAPLAASGGWQHLVPIRFEAPVSATRAAMIFSIAGASTTNTTLRSNQMTIAIGLYSRGTGANSANIYAATSASSTWSWSWNSTTNTSVLAQVTGWRRFNIPMTVNAPPGDYWYGVWYSQAQSVTGSGAISLMAVAPIAISNIAFAGNISSTTNSSRQPILGLGVFSSTTIAALTTSMALTDIKAGAVTGALAQPWVLLTSFDLN